MKSKNAAKIRAAVIRYLLLALGTVIFTLPMIYMISTSLRPNGALYEYPPRFFPKWEALTLENYDYILHQSKFYLNFLNSVMVSVSTIALAAAVGSAMAFVLGKFKSKCTNVLFAFIIITMIIPGTTMIVPQFELATRLGMVNMLQGLMGDYIPSFVYLPLTVMQSGSRTAYRAAPEVFLHRIRAMQTSTPPAVANTADHRAIFRLTQTALRKSARANTCL